jgi:hypothetical protein
MQAYTITVEVSYRVINSGTTPCPAMLLAEIMVGQKIAPSSKTSPPPSFLALSFLTNQKPSTVRIPRNKIQNLLPQPKPVDCTFECDHHSRQDVFQSPQLVSCSPTPRMHADSNALIFSNRALQFFQSNPLTLLPDRTIRSQEPVALPPQGHRTRRLPSKRNRYKPINPPARYIETAKYHQ